MTASPITERQRAILKVLTDGRLATPADIAQAIGIHKGPRRSGTVWSGYQSPAQYVVGSLTGLCGRGFLRHARRPDGRSGSAYVITDTGREAVLDA